MYKKQIRGFTKIMPLSFVGVLFLFMAISFNTTPVYAASLFSVVQTGPITVGDTSVDLEIEYTVDTSQQTWADGDIFSLILSDNFQYWVNKTFTVEYDTDTINDGIGETSITSGVNSGQYQASGDLDIKWSSAWGAVVDGQSTIRVLITDSSIPPQYEDATSIVSFEGWTADVGDTNLNDSPGQATFDVDSADAVMSLTFDGYPIVGSTFSGQLNVTIPVPLQIGDTITFDAPANVTVSGISYDLSNVGTSGLGRFTCSPSGQTITCTVITGAVNAGAGHLVMQGFSASSSTTGQVLSNGIIYDSSASANTATDITAGSVQDTVDPGPATINGGTNEYSHVRASDNYSIVLTVPSSGITAVETSPTFTIPAGFTAPHIDGGDTPPTSSAEVSLDGEWYVEASGGSCVVDPPNGAGSTAASGQVITVDVTADCSSGDTITLTYQGYPPNSSGTVYDLDVSINGTLIDVPPTITLHDQWPVEHHSATYPNLNSLIGIAGIGGSNVVVNGFRLISDSGSLGNYINFNQLRIKVEGNGGLVDAEVTNLRVIHDLDDDGVADAGELLSPIVSVSNPTFLGSGVNDVVVDIDIEETTQEQFLIVVDIASSIADGDTLVIYVDGYESHVTGGDLSVYVDAIRDSSLLLTATNPPPSVVNTYSVDTDGDGDIDAIDVEFNQAIDDSSVVLSEIEFDHDMTNDGIGEEVPSGGSTSVSYPALDTDVDDEFYRFTLTTGIPGTEKVYMHVIGTSLVNANSVAIVTSNNVGTSNDRAEPVYVSSETLDNDNDGTVDYVKIVYSEDILDTSVSASDYEIGIADTTAGNLIESLTSLTPSSGNEIDVADDNSIYIGVTSGGENILSNKTDYTFNVEQVGAVSDISSNALASFIPNTSSDKAVPQIISATYLDTDGDVQVETIRTTWSENVTMSGSTSVDWTVVGGDINAVFSLANDDVSPGTTLDVLVNADSGETGSLTALSLVYDNDDINDSIVDANSNLAGTSSTVTITDSAPPIIVDVKIEDVAHDGLVDKIIFTWSENIDTDDGVAPVAGDMPTTILSDGLTASYATATISDPSGISNIVTVTGITGQVTENTAIGSTSISGDLSTFWEDVALTPNSADITFATGNESVTDLATPVVVSNTLDYNDDASELVVTFSEVVVAASTVFTSFHINDITGVDDVTISQATTSGDGDTLVFPLTEAERVSALAISPVVLDVDTGAVTDIAVGLTLVGDDNNATIETSDTNLPTITQWGINFDTNELSLTFSETVDASTLDSTAITLQNAITSTASTYTLTGGITSSTDGLTIIINLSAADVIAIKNNSAILTSLSNSFLVATSMLIDDMSINDIAVIADGSALQATTFVGDGSVPAPAPAPVPAPVVSSGGGGGGGGSGGGGATTSYTSNTKTSNRAVNINTITGHSTYSSPIDIKDANITIDVDANTATAELTSEGGTLTLRPNKLSTISLFIPKGTTVSASADWNGKIVPPLIKSLSLLNTDGEVIKGSDDMLKRSEVKVIIELGSNVPLSFNNEVEIRVPIDLPDGSVIDIYTMNGTENWEYHGQGVVLDGILTFKTDHFSLYAFAPTGEIETLHTSAEEQSGYFTDTAGHWAESYIDRIAELGIVQGKSNGIYAPNDNITRAELLKIAINTFGYEVPAEIFENPVSDVDVNDWYAPYVKAAFDNNIIYGFENGLNPNSRATRALSSTILTKAAGYTDVDQNFADNYLSHSNWTYAAFTDVLIDEWFAPYIAYLSDTGVVSGYGDGTFGPNDSITRAEVAKIVIELLELNTINEI